MASYHIRATFLPEGDAPSDLWVLDGHLTFQPVEGAEVLGPLSGFVLPGMVDAHAHLAMDMGGGRRPPGPAVIEANVSANLAAGVTAIRDPGSPRSKPSNGCNPAVGRDSRSRRRRASLPPRAATSRLPNGRMPNRSRMLPPPTLALAHHG